MPDQESQAVSPSPVEEMMHVMRGVLLQLSGLAGILAFLGQMWNHHSLGQSLYTGVVIGGGLYIILLLVDMAFQRIIAAEVASSQQKSDGDRSEGEEVPLEKNSTVPADESTGKETNTGASPDDGSAPAIATSSSSPNTSSDREMASA